MRIKIEIGLITFIFVIGLFNFNSIVNAGGVIQPANIQELTVCPKDDIIWYTEQDGYKEINNFLRNKQSIQMGQDSAERIHDWLRNQRLLKETYALRGISPEGLYELLISSDINVNEQDFCKLLNEIDEIKNLLIGNEITEKAFMSTSYIPENFHGSIRSPILEGSKIILRICAPELTCAYDISTIRGVRSSGEKELLFDYGTRLHITNVQKFCDAVKDETGNNILKTFQDECGLSNKYYVYNVGMVEKIVIDAKVVN